MRPTLRRLLLLITLAAGGVVAWQRRHETPPTPPPSRSTEPFMRAVPSPGQAVDGGPAAEAGIVDAARDEAGLGDAGPGAAAADDLKVIAGIGPKLELQLHEAGITTLAQLAALDDAGIAALEAQLGGIPGRIRRGDWVGQAQRLQQG